MTCIWVSGKNYGYKATVYMPVNRNIEHLERYNNIPKIDFSKKRYRFCPYCGLPIEKVDTI